MPITVSGSPGLRCNVIELLDAQTGIACFEQRLELMVLGTSNPCEETVDQSVYQAPDS